MERRGFFSIEVKSKTYLQNVTMSSKPHENVVIEGFLGEYSKIELIDDIILTFEGANGVIRLDVCEDDLWQGLIGKRKTSKGFGINDSS
jgi:hypothetical protein